MIYIAPQNYDYIINKYPKKRFTRKDEVFSEDSGTSPEEIMAGIWENDKKYEHLPHPVRKARALEYILKHTRISCDGRNIFPSINMIDRPLNKTLIGAWHKEVFEEIVPEVNSRRRQLERDGIVTIWPDYDHSVPVWERLFDLGITGILDESESARKGAELTAEEDAFFEGIKITYEATLAFIDRLYAISETDKMRNALQNLRHGAPKSFYDALLLSYIYFMISEPIDGLQVRSLSNFD